MVELIHPKFRFPLATPIFQYDVLKDDALISHSWPRLRCSFEMMKAAADVINQKGPLNAPVFILQPSNANDTTTGNLILESFVDTYQKRHARSAKGQIELRNVQGELCNNFLMQCMMRVSEKAVLL